MSIIIPGAMYPVRSLRCLQNAHRSGLRGVVRPLSTKSHYDFIQTSEPADRVGLVTLNRPRSFNSLCTPLMEELNDALKTFDRSDAIGAIILTGSEKVFAAGADIKEMAGLTFADAYTGRFIELWSELTALVRKPMIAAVSGHALGGGCELAMMCDIIYCTASASFGQPEVKLGTIPGAGGSQRLTRAVGKSRAMEMVLTGRPISGDEAARCGLAARAFPDHAALMRAVVEVAQTMAGYSRVAVMAAKEVVNRSQEVGLRDGVEFERRMFHALFGTEDQKIGMQAFVEKKKAVWKNR